MEFIRPAQYQADSPEGAYLELLNTLQTNLTAFEITFDSVVHAFANRVREERKVRRAQIKQSQPGGERKFSSNVLLYRFHNGTVELVWTEIWYKPDDPTVRYRRIPQSKGIAKISDVIRGAHPDEVDLLREHEDQARRFRKLWIHYQQIRKELGRFSRSARKVLQVADAPEDELVVAS